ncbi:unnamed protein product [Rotaria sordida]|uniref:Ferric-chelate reductase 1 n=1 Tax=Rotaria sordida TaxID=392033 RepID=A0A815IEB7_9BILA|nr:unnamed protein product [Rotaria sordida]CAF3714479.1 unnamed protein product [Rotaria sordida]
MNSFVYDLLIFILISIQPGHSYPTGAPLTACASMSPQHNVASQECSSKYTLNVDKSQYYINDTVRITIRGSTNNDTFRGVLIIAKTKTNEAIIGTWSVAGLDIKTVACGGKSDTGVTHNSRTDKSSIEAIWYPPSNITDNFTVIKATIVTTYAQIYVGCFSTTLTAKYNDPSIIKENTTGAVVTNYTNSSSPTTTTTTTSITSTSNDTGVVISWTYANGITAVKMQINNLKTSQWLALGLSLDSEMGEDHVFVCKHLADDTLSIERRINPGSTSPPILASTMRDPGGTLTTSSLKLENGIAYCEFSLSNFTSSKQRRRRDISALSQSTTYIPLIAMGDLDSSGEMRQHTTRTPLSQNVQLNKETTITYNADLTESSRTSLMKAHGIIMLFTWIFYVPTGILIALYFKKCWPNRKLCGKPIWFAVHRALMTIATVLTLIAFILILAYKKGEWVSRKENLEYSHSIIGIMVVCFTLIQLIMALYRCEPHDKYRFIFNYLHGFLGILSLILATIAIFIAMFFDNFNFKTSAEWGILTAWTCWIFILFLIFWMIGYCFKEDSVKEIDMTSIELNDRNQYSPTPSKSIQPEHNVKEDWIKGILILIHIIIAFALSLALVILVGKA